MFKLSNTAIEEALPLKAFNNARTGGMVTFVGLVRDHNDGKSVTSLEYQAYEEMALLEGEKIVNWAKDRFDIIDAFCIHRVGHLQIGEMAIKIVVIAEHRKEAFLASEFIIDTVKSRVPIWKKEHYANYDSQWVSCPGCEAIKHNHSDLHDQAHPS